MPSNGKDYDFLSHIDPSDSEWIELASKAKARQEAIREGVKVPKLTDAERDEQRRLASLAHQAQTKAMAEAINIPEIAEPAKVGVVTAQVPASNIDIWLVELPDDVVFYAPSWKQLKKLMKDKEGVWEVKHFVLKPNAEDILGLFASDLGYKYPEESIKEEFDIMVREGMVFKSDSE